MDWERITKKMMAQSLKEGEAGAAKARAQKAMFAQQLQDRRNIGAAGVATIGQEGQDRRLASEQAYGKPAQTAAIAQMGAGTEGTRVDTEGKRFHQGLTKEYGRDFMEAMLRDKQGDGGAERSLPSPMEGLPEADLSPVAEIPTDPVAQSGGQGLMQDWSSAWERSSQTPIGRGLGLPELNWMTQKGFEGLDYLGKGMEKGLGSAFKYLFTPTKKKKKVDNRTASLKTYDPYEKLYEKPFGIAGVSG